MSLKWLRQGLVPASGSHIAVIGNFQVADLATATTPVAIPGTSTFTQLTNDGEGVRTSNANAPDAITELWDVVDDEFDFSQLSVGDQLTIRASMLVDILSVNTDIELEFAVFTAAPAFVFSLNWFTATYKTAGVKSISPTSVITIDDAAILAQFGQFRMKADKACNVEVVGWNYLVNLRS